MLGSDIQVDWEDIAQRELKSDPAQHLFRVTGKGCQAKESRQHRSAIPEFRT